MSTTVRTSKSIYGGYRSEVSSDGKVTGVGYGKTESSSVDAAKIDSSNKK